MLRVFPLLLLKKRKETGAFRGRLCQGSRFYRRGGTMIPDNKTGSCDRRHVLIADSNGCEVIRIISNLNLAAAQGCTCLIFHTFKAEAAGLIDSPGFMVKECIGHNRCIKERQGAAVPVPFLPGSNSFGRNTHSKALVVFADAFVRFIVIIRFQPGIPCMVQFFQSSDSMRFCLCQECVNKTVEALYTALGPSVISFCVDNGNSESVRCPEQMFIDVLRTIVGIMPNSG